MPTLVSSKSRSLVSMSFSTIFSSVPSSSLYTSNMSLSFFIDFANLKVLTVSQRLSLQIDQLAHFKLSILGAAKDLSKALDALVILLNEAFKGSRGYSASAFAPGPGEARGKVSALTGWELLKFHWALEANVVCSRHDVVTLLDLQAFLHLLMATEHGLQWLQVVGSQEGLWHIHAKLLDTGLPGPLRESTYPLPSWGSAQTVVWSTSLVKHSLKRPSFPVHALSNSGN